MTHYPILIFLAISTLTATGSTGVFYLLWRDAARDAAQERHNARHDNLTGLPNRAGLLEHLAARNQHRRPYALALIDLDDFKAVNDTHGHHTGDTVLQRVAERLARLARQPGWYAARLAGDEFVLITPAQDATSHARGAHHAIAERIHIGDPLTGLTLRIHASIGVTHAQPGDPAHQLLRHADAAMYVAKLKGNGVAEYDPATPQPTIGAGRQPRTNTNSHWPVNP